jgi:hypothetical protein
VLRSSAAHVLTVLQCCRLIISVSRAGWQLPSSPEMAERADLITFLLSADEQVTTTRVSKIKQLLQRPCKGPVFWTELDEVLGAPGCSGGGVEDRDDNILYQDLGNECIK